MLFQHALIRTSWEFPTILSSAYISHTKSFISPTGTTNHLLHAQLQMLNSQYQIPQSHMPISKQNPPSYICLAIIKYLPSYILAALAKHYAQLRMPNPHQRTAQLHMCRLIKKNCPTAYAQQLQEPCLNGNRPLYFGTQHSNT
jgi:hypothetical protein